MRPVLFVTGHVPAYRIGGLARLHEREGIELALFGGRSLHGGAPHAGPIPVPHRHLRPRELLGLASSGSYRGVICPTGGRLAPMASWAGARRARVPLIVWASLWAHPRSVAHAFTYLPLRHLYSSADALVTYGEHVSTYVRAHGARNVHVAPQAVDNDFWRADDEAPPNVAAWPTATQTRFLFVGRPGREKGIETLISAWVGAGLAPSEASLALVGLDGVAFEQANVRAVGAQPPEELRRIYSTADVLVVPSIATRNFREPWGLVVNEAMNRGVAVVVSDAVGAAAGGLIRDGENGLVFPAGDVGALAATLRRVAYDPQLRARLGAAAASDVLDYDYDAWAAGFSRALGTLGLSRGRW